MHPFSTHYPLVDPASLSRDELSALARSIARSTALDPRAVRRALTGQRVQDSTRLAVERALQERCASAKAPADERGAA